MPENLRMECFTVLLLELLSGNRHTSKVMVFRLSSYFDSVEEGEQEKAIANIVDGRAPQPGKKGKQ